MSKDFVKHEILVKLCGVSASDFFSVYQAAREEMEELGLFRSRLEIFEGSSESSLKK